MSRRLTIALVALGVLLVLGQVGTLAYLFLRPAAGVAAAGDPPKESGGEETFHLALPKFVTDLADRDRLRYVDVTVVLAFRDAKALEEAKKQTPAIRDAILGNLRTRTAADLAGAAGKERLAESLAEVLSPLVKGSLRKVFITDLVVQ